MLEYTPLVKLLTFVACITNNYHIQQIMILYSLHSCNIKNEIIDVPMDIEKIISNYFCGFQRLVNHIASHILQFYNGYIQFFRAQRAEETLEKITHMAYTTFARGLLERDRFIFTLLLAIEVTSCNKHFYLNIYKK